MIEEFEKYPLPPPWRFIAAEGAYINDDTGDCSTIHPYQRLLDRRAAEQEVLNVGDSNSARSSSGAPNKTQGCQNITGATATNESKTQGNENIGNGSGSGSYGDNANTGDDGQPYF